MTFSSSSSLRKDGLSILRRSPRGYDFSDDSSSDSISSSKLSSFFFFCLVWSSSFELSFLASSIFPNVETLLLIMGRNASPCFLPPKDRSPDLLSDTMCSVLALTDDSCSQVNSAKSPYSSVRFRHPQLHGQDRNTVFFSSENLPPSRPFLWRCRSVNTIYLFYVLCRRPNDWVLDGVRRTC